MTKRERERAEYNYKVWEMSEKDSIYKAYKRPSFAKYKAFERCREMCRNDDGWGCKVVSTNCSTFTAGYEYADKESGVCKFVYITPWNVYEIESPCR